MTDEIDQGEAAEGERLRIFVSYRRTDASADAGRLYDRLIKSFEEKNVFIDVDTIEPGLDFRDVIHESVGSCDAFVAVIGKNWLGQRFLRRPRIDSEMDYVRIELEAALIRNVRVIPVLVEDAEMPAADDLPDSVRKLAYRHALPIRHESFHADASRLVEVLAKLEHRKAAAGEPEPIAPPPPLPSRTTPRRRTYRVRLPRRAALAGAVALAAGVAALVAVLLLRSGSTSSSSRVHPPTQAPLRWKLAAGGPDVFGGSDASQGPRDQTAKAVTFLGGGAALAVGYEKASAGEDVARAPLAWRFAGGRWTRDGATFDDPGFSSLETVATNGSVLVVGGRVGERRTPTQPAVWTLANGASDWRLVCLGQTEIPCTFFGINGPSIVSGLIALSRRGFVAVGATATKAALGGPTVRYATAWASSDGSSWSRTWLDTRRGGMKAVAVAGGGLVAVGDRRGLAAVWTAGTGAEHWQPASDPVLRGADELNGVAARGRIVVAAGDEAGSGRCNGSRGAVFRSANRGRHWQRVGSSAFAYTGQHIDSVAVLGGRFVALGSDGIGCSQIAAAWSSPDGNKWTRIRRSFPANSQLSGGAAGGGISFVVGAGPAPGGAGDRNAAIWRVTAKR